MAVTRGDNDAAVIGVYAAVTYDVISATNSSPQTTEINAGARAGTLMKWVKVGLAQAALFVAIGMAAEPPGKKWRPLVGGGLAGVLLWFQYVHAMKSGLESCEPGTETYDAGTRGAREGGHPHPRGWQGVSSAR